MPLAEDFKELLRIVLKHPVTPSRFKTPYNDLRRCTSALRIDLRSGGHYTLRWDEKRPRWFDNTFEELWNRLETLSSERR